MRSLSSPGYHDVIFFDQIRGADEGGAVGEDPEQPQDEEEACDAAEDDADDRAGGGPCVEPLVAAGDVALVAD